MSTPQLRNSALSNPIKSVNLPGVLEINSQIAGHKQSDIVTLNAKCATVAADSGDKGRKKSLEVDVEMWGPSLKTKTEPSRTRS